MAETKFESYKYQNEAKTNYCKNKEMTVRPMVVLTQLNIRIPCYIEFERKIAKLYYFFLQYMYYQTHMTKSILQYLYAEYMCIQRLEDHYRSHTRMDTDTR
jgi:hypothetical protein